MPEVTSESPPVSFAGTEKAVRTVVVPDRFSSRLWAVLVATILHPFTTTIIRVVESNDHDKK